MGLILLSPLLVLIPVLIKRDSPGPVFYKSIRVGRGGCLFEMRKFRTMIVDADKWGPLITARDDSRITPVGSVLRRTKLDEIPTLWNVLIGDMSFVGPRPENPKSAALYDEQQRRILTIRPGITSLATIKYRDEEALLIEAEDLEAKYFEIMQDKLSLELDYLDRRSPRLDLVILLSTILAVFKIKVSNA